MNKEKLKAGSLDLSLLEKHSQEIPIRYNYSHNLKDMEKVALLMEANGHLLAHNVILLADGPLWDATCTVCDLWAVYTHIHSLDFNKVIIAGKGLLKHLCYPITVH